MVSRQELLNPASIKQTRGRGGIIDHIGHTAQAYGYLSQAAVSRRDPVSVCCRDPPRQFPQIALLFNGF